MKHDASCYLEKLSYLKNHAITTISVQVAIVRRQNKIISLRCFSVKKGPIHIVTIHEIHRLFEDVYLTMYSVVPSEVSHDVVPVRITRIFTVPCVRHGGLSPRKPQGGSLAGNDTPPNHLRFVALDHENVC